MYEYIRILKKGLNSETLWLGLTNKIISCTSTCYRDHV